MTEQLRLVPLQGALLRSMFKASVARFAGCRGGEAHPSPGAPLIRCPSSAADSAAFLC
jgi:hypothetical protein